MNQQLQKLKERYAAGERLKYLFFWGHLPGHGQTVGPFLFSQWYPSEFTVDGIKYQTAEHWMMAGKQNYLKIRKRKKKLSMLRLRDMQKIWADR